MSVIYNSLSYLGSSIYNMVYGTSSVNTSASSVAPTNSAVQNLRGRVTASASSDDADGGLQRAIRESLATPIERVIAIQGSLAAPIATVEQSPSSNEEEALQRAILASLKERQGSIRPGQNRFFFQVEDTIPLASWIDSYKDNEHLREQLENLSTVYKFVQPIRGDGNCFYTSYAMHMLLGFGSLNMEQKTELIGEFERCLASATAKRAVISAFRSLLNGINIHTEDTLMLQFVECLRAIGVQYVREHRSEFFFDHDHTFDKLVGDLRKMGEWAEEPMIVAIVKALKFPVRVVRVTHEFTNARGIAGAVDYNAPGRSLRRDAEPHRVLLFTDGHKVGHYQLLSKN